MAWLRRQQPAAPVQRWSSRRHVDAYRRTVAMAVLLLLGLVLEPQSLSGAVARHQGMLPLPLPLGGYDGTSSTQQRGLLQASDRAAGVDAAEVAAAAGYPSAGAVLVSTAAQLVAAIADPGVQVAVLASSVSLTEADWAPVAQPVVEVRRNLTLLGAHTDPAAWPTLNLGYTAHVDSVGSVRDAKVRMGPGCIITFQHLVLTDGRELPQFLFVGLDIFAQSPVPNSTLAAAWPLVVVHEAALWQRSCLPLSIKGLPSRNLPRPAFLPGVQNSTGTYLLRPPNCTDDASAPPMTRCWPARGLHHDMAMYAYDADAYDRQTLAGYAMHLLNATFWCDILMTDECVTAHGGYLACYYSLYPYSRKVSLTSPPPSAAPNTTSGGGGSVSTAAQVMGAQSAATATAEAEAGKGGSDSTGSPSVLAPVLCGVLAGLVALALGAGLLVAVIIYRRRRTQQHKQQQREKDCSSESAASTPHVRQLLLTKAGQGVAASNPPAVPAPAAAGPGAGRYNDSSSHALPVSSLAHKNRCSNAGASGKLLAFRCATDSDTMSMLVSGAYGSHCLDASDRAGGASPCTRPSGAPSADTPSNEPTSTTSPTYNMAIQTALAIEPIEEDEIALVPVTPLTPFQSHIPLDVKLGCGGGEVQLLPVTLGKGACGRVVQGVWCGRRVAVKLLHRGRFNAAAAAHVGGLGIGEVFHGAPPLAAAEVAGTPVRPRELVTPTPRGWLLDGKEQQQVASAGANGGPLLSVGMLSHVADGDQRTGLAPPTGASTGLTLVDSCMRASLAVPDSSSGPQPVQAPATPPVDASVPEATMAQPGPAEAALLALAAAATPAALAMGPWWLGTGSFGGTKETGAVPVAQAAHQMGGVDEGSKGRGNSPSGVASSPPEAHAAATPAHAAALDAAGAAAAAAAPPGQGDLEEQLPLRVAGAGQAPIAAMLPQAAARPLGLASVRMGGSSVLDPLKAGSDALGARGAPQQLLAPQPRLDRSLLSKMSPDSLMSISILADGESSAMAGCLSGWGTRHKQSLPPVADDGATAATASVSTISDGGPSAAPVAATTAASANVAASIFPDVSTLDDAAGETAAAAAGRLQSAVRRRQPLTHGGAVRRTMAQEVEVLARLQHANIVQLLAANLNPACPCLVVELMDTSLDKVLYGGVNAAGPAAPAGGAGAGGGCLSPRSQAPLLPLPKVLHIALQVARALAYLHPTIIHRDLKPANVLVSDPDSASPVVKIADFGLSRLQDTVLITAHVDVGTAPYMAPEALDARNCVITHHSDMYSYGIMLYEMLAGARPWRGMNMLQIAVAVCDKQQRPRVEDLGQARCPPALRALVAQCWDPVPERRPSAAEVAKQLAIMMQQL